MKAEYLKGRTKNFIDVQKVLMIHYFEFDKNFVFDGESHDYWEMVYVDKGCVSIKRNDEEITLSQGEVVFHCPNEFHSIKALNSSPNFFVVCFVCNSLPMQEFVRFKTVLKKDLQPFISSIIKEAGRTYTIPKNDPSLQYMTKKDSAPPGAEQLIKSYLEQLLILLMRNKTNSLEKSAFPSKESSETHLVSAVKEYINKNSEGIIYVSDICRALGYSKSYLSKIFKEQSGETISGYVTLVKITKAKNLIREGHLSFAEISDRLSFDNPQYFSRVFKRITGMTPTEFKLTLKI